MARENPLETFFDMAQGSVDPIDQRPFAITDVTDSSELVTIDEHPVVSVPVVKVPFKETLDDEDLLIADQLQSVFDKSIAVFHSQQELTEIVDPKFAARNAEVAQQYLNTALQTVQLRARIKDAKDKQKINANVGAVINGDVTQVNNVITANRNDLIKMLHAKKKDIDGGMGPI